MSFQPELPNSSRLIDWGHSWVAPPPNPYGVSNVSTLGITGTPFYPTDGNMWPAALRDALGIGSQGYTKQYIVPSVAAATATTSTFLDYMPGDGTIDCIYYIPNGAATGANTNTRGIALNVKNWLSSPGFGAVNFVSGVDMVQGTAIRLMGMNEATGLTSAAATFAPVGPYAAALRGVSGSAAMTPQEIYWSSVKVGTGGTFIDPGGTVIVRYGTRYRNYGVAAATLLGQGGPQIANWNTVLSWSPWSRPNAIEVNVTANAATSATSISCSALFYPIPSGTVINFSGGRTATLTATANWGVSSLTVSALAAGINAGDQGHAQASNGGGGSYESLSPTGINVFTHGINDADIATLDRPAWIETVRACIAKVICPAWLTPDQGNFKYTNGGGTWTTFQTPALGGLPGHSTPVFSAVQQITKWTGTVSGTPKVDISIGPAFEGGTVDLVLLAVAGSSYGVAGTITVDGGTPSQGAVTFNTSGVSTSGLAVRTVPGTVATATSTTLTGTSTDFQQSVFGTNDVGKIIAATDIPVGTIVTAVASTTSLTLGTAATGTHSGNTATIRGYFPMVKRITGLSAGAHTITLTITGSDSTATSCLFLYGLGLESQSPTTPVLWCNIARATAQSSGQKTASVNYNTDSAAVIAGTAAAITGNSTEPGFGRNVVLVDVDTLFGGASPNSAYFLPDGIHLNSLGHRLMARTLFKAIRDNFSPDQLMAR